MEAISNIVTKTFQWPTAWGITMKQFCFIARDILIAACIISLWYFLSQSQWPNNMLHPKMRIKGSA